MVVVHVFPAADTHKHSLEDTRNTGTQTDLKKVTPRTEKKRRKENVWR